MNWLDLLATSSVIGASLVQTGTTTITATATGGVPTPTEVELATTPVVVPTLPPAGTLQGNPFSGDFLTQAANPPLGPFGVAFALLSLIVLGAGIYLYFVLKNRWRRTNSLNFRLANFWGIALIAVGALSVLFVLFRLINLDGLNLRFWLYLMLLVMIGLGLYAAYFFTQQYPKQRAAWAKKQSPRAIKATARTRTAPPTRAGAASSRGSTPDTVTPAAAPKPAGDPGNPRGTSPRRDRRRAKR
jgi:hypothetical protein